MVTVQYSIEFPYRIHQDELFPMVMIALRNPATRESVDQDAFLDSGASRSIFLGEVAHMIGLDLLEGEPWEFRTNTGQPVHARIHRVEMVLVDGMAPFSLDLAFSTDRLQRNLLGRDFFHLVQIGFRERYAQLLVEPVP